MLNVKVGVAFVYGNYKEPAVMEILQDLYVEKVDSYSTDEWTVDIALLHKEVPEIFWGAAEEDETPQAFCLSDIYVYTV